MFVYDIGQILVNVFARRTAKNVQMPVQNVAPEQKRKSSLLSADGALHKSNSRSNTHRIMIYYNRVVQSVRKSCGFELSQDKDRYLNYCFMVSI